MSTPDPTTEDYAAWEADTEGISWTAAPSQWGIGLVPWLWATRVRILIVIDGRINLGYGEYGFGLGPVLDTLRDQSFAWWVRFEVTVRKRDPNWQTAAFGRFRFTESGFDLDNFDQVWFFGDWPGEKPAGDPTVSDDVIDRPEFLPLDNDELRILAEWMERGGGVFAAGDHSLLGASMCSRIPRVRTMRKWKPSQGLPSFKGADRHETLQRAEGASELEPDEWNPEWEGDRYPQRIDPVYRYYLTPPFFFDVFPHPLLCGRRGVIDRFPDHMHEGVVVEDDNVVLDQPLEIPGFDGVEYPPFPQVIKPAAIGPQPVGGGPRPQVIAHGWTTNLDADPRRFALIGVYDGDPVKIGRVVVDSTWHHWFSMNLVGFRNQEPDLYRGMQDYYRNVALWLSRPQQRASMLFAATWGVLVGSHPGAFGRVMDIWEIGQRVVDVIGRTAPQCLVSELVATVIGTRQTSEDAARRPKRRPAPLRPSAELVNQAIVGGIGKELLDPAYNHIREYAHGRPTVLDEDVVRRRGLAGVAAGRRALIDVLNENASELEALRDVLTDQLGQSEIDDIPIHGDHSQPRQTD